VHPAPIGKPGVDEGHRIVKAPTDGRGKSLGESPHLALAGESEVGELESGAAVDENLIRTIDQDVGDSWPPKQRLQRTGTHAVPSQRLHHSKHCRVAYGKTLSLHGSSDVPGCVVTAENREVIAYEIESSVVKIRIAGNE
jgi:hypothetical protein